MSDGSDKRGMPRFPLNVPVAVKKDSEIIESTTRDVSASGVFVYLPTAMKEGEEIEFSITLPQELTLAGSIQVTCKGTIVRVSPAANGLLGIAATIDTYNFVNPARDAEQSQAASV